MTASAGAERPWITLGTRLGWGAVDQGLSSATNLALALLAGRLLGPTGLGAVTIGFAAYLVILGFHRALVSSPLVVSTAGLDSGECRRATRHALSLTVAAGFLACLALGALGAVLAGSAGRGLILFAPWMVPALIQDLWRHTLFRDQRGASAATNDAAWALGTALTLPIAIAIGTDWAVVACWGAGVGVAAALGFLQTATSPGSIANGLDWWVRTAWPFGRWLAAESIVYSVGSQFVVFLMAALLGAAAVGGFKAAQTLFAPLTLLGPAIAMPALPEIAASFRHSPARAQALATKVSALLCALTLAYLLAAGIFSEQFMALVFGGSFAAYGSLIWGLGAQQVAAALGSGPGLMLKAARRGRAILWIRALTSAVTVAAVASLASIYGLSGTVWGMAVGTSFGTAALIVVSRPEATALHRRMLPWTRRTQASDGVPSDTQAGIRSPTSGPPET